MKNKFVSSKVSNDSAASSCRVREFGSNVSYNNGKENVTSYIIHKCSFLLNSAYTRHKFNHPEDGGSIFLGKYGRNILLYKVSEPERL
jgi:hypothetical protein